MNGDIDTEHLDRRMVRQHFSSHAAEYDRYARVQKTVVNRLVELMAQQSQPPSGLGLEVGCGTGMLSRAVGQTFPQAHLVLSDVAHGMSLHCQKLFPQAMICDADAGALPFVDDCFDFLISTSVYQWVEDLNGAFAEIERVLRPGGQVALALFGDRTLFELRNSHRQALDRGLSHGQSFPAQDDLRCGIAGTLTIEQLFSENETEWHPDVPTLLRNLKKIGAQNASAHRPPGLASRRVMQRMYRCYEQEYGQDGQIPATYQVIYLLARKPG